jgi:hypothetical protein
MAPFHAYYSTHGDLSEILFDDKIRMVIVIIHGAAINADGYFCSAIATIEGQQEFAKDSVMVIAPRFPMPTDMDLRPPSDYFRPFEWKPVRSALVAHDVAMG